MTSPDHEAMFPFETLIARQDGDALYLLPSDHGEQLQAMTHRIREVFMTADGGERRKKLWAIQDDETTDQHYKWSLIQDALPIVIGWELDEAPLLEVTLVGRRLAEFITFARRHLRP